MLIHVMRLDVGSETTPTSLLKHTKRKQVYADGLFHDDESWKHQRLRDFRTAQRAFLKGCFESLAARTMNDTKLPFDVSMK